MNWCQGFCRTCGTGCGEYCEEIKQLRAENVSLNDTIVCLRAESTADLIGQEHRLGTRIEILERELKQIRDDWNRTARFANSEALKTDAKLRLAVKALEFYQNHVPLQWAVTPESAKYEREFGIGRRATEALAKIRGEA